MGHTFIVIGRSGANQWSGSTYIIKTQNLFGLNQNPCDVHSNGLSVWRLKQANTTKNTTNTAVLFNALLH